MRITETYMIEQTQTTHIKCDVCDNTMKTSYDGPIIGRVQYAQHPQILSDRIITPQEYSRAFPTKDLCGDCLRKVFEFIEVLSNA